MLKNKLYHLNGHLFYKGAFCVINVKWSFLLFFQASWIRVISRILPKVGPIKPKWST